MKTMLLTAFTFLLFGFQALAYQAGDIVYDRVHQSRAEILGAGQQDGYLHIRLLDGDRAGISFDFYAGNGNLEPLDSQQAPVVATDGAGVSSSGPYVGEEAQIAASVPLVAPEVIAACAANISRGAAIDYDYAQKLCTWDSSQLMQSCLISGYQYHTDGTEELVRFCYESQKPQLEAERARLAAVRQQKVANLLAARRQAQAQAQEAARQQALQAQAQQAVNQRAMQDALGRQQAEQIREMQDQQRAQQQAQQAAERARQQDLQRAKDQLNAGTSAAKPAAPVARPVAPVVVKPAAPAPVVAPAPQKPAAQPAAPAKAKSSSSSDNKDKKSDSVIMDLPIDGQ